MITVDRLLQSWLSTQIDRAAAGKIITLTVSGYRRVVEEMCRKVGPARYHNEFTDAPMYVAFTPKERAVYVIAARWWSKLSAKKKGEVCGG